MSDKNKNAIKIYDLVAEDYSRAYDPIDLDTALVFPNSFLSHLKPNSSIIDLGCGTGYSVGYFLRKGMRADGVDLSSGMIKIAKRNYPRANFFIEDMRKFQPDKKVDAVWIGYSIFHFEQTGFEETMGRVRTYLKPGGILGIVVQEGNGEVEIPETFLPEKTIYIHLYTEQQIVAILGKYDFDVIDIKRKLPSENEFPYNKLLIIAKLK